MGQQAPGDQPGGVRVGFGDIAVAPTDDFVLFTRDDELAVGWTGTGRVEALPVENPTRLAFSKQRRVVYVGSMAAGNFVTAVDVQTRARLWSRPMESAATSRLRLVSTEDDRHVVAADVANGTVRVLDAYTGDVKHTTNLSGDIVDVQILPDDRRAIVVMDHVWSGDDVTTRIVFVDLDARVNKEVAVPNCADRVAVSADGSRAFLAPTTCVEPSESRPKDPISLIDLAPGSEAFVKNLPGFGPVAIAPVGTMAVGFLDMSAIDAALFEDTSLIPGADSERYHLMLIDTATLDYQFVEVGDRLPRFAVTPDGNVLLVDSSWTTDVPARLFDVGAKEWRFINGAPLLLDNFVITSDSSHAYVIETRFYNGLYDLDIAGGTSIEIPLDFSPRNINISPSDQLLYLRKDDDEVCVFSLAERRCTAELNAGVLVGQ
jgi:WD40 repeat protein